jgi:hypothetical protein
MIEFDCEKCGKKIRVNEELAGRTGKCSGCGEKLVIPSASVSQPEPKKQRSSEVSKVNSNLVSPPPLVSPQPLPQSSPGVAVQVNVDNSPVADGLGISSLIVGILSFFVCWIPLINFGVGGLGLLLGIAGIVMAIQRKGNAIGYSIAGTAVSTVSFLLGVLYLTMFAGALNSNAQKSKNGQERISTQSNELSDPATSDLSTVASNNSKVEPENSKWAPVQIPIKIGSVELKVTEAKIGKVSLTSEFTDRVTETPEEYFMIRLKIKNQDLNKKINYRSWSGDFATISGITASLTDEHGNKYRFIKTPSTFKIKDTDGSDSIYPQKEIQDAVVFEVPVATSTKFFLTLSAKGCEEKGEFLIEVPRSYLSGANVAQNNVPGTVPNTQARSAWINETYKSRIVRVGPKKWQELRNDTNELSWNYDELGENAEYIEVFLVERMQKGRIYADRLELFIDNQWVNAAQGRWEK